MFFPSKRDVWMTFIIWLFALLLMVPPVLFPEFGVWMTPDFFDQQWIKIVILWSIGLSLLWIWFKTGYTIEDNTLKIQYGPFKKRIKIEEITSTRRTRNPFTDPALSIDKIEINYERYKTIAISPNDHVEFVHQMLIQNPSVKFDSQFEDEITEQP
ncbi:PH domain-containing protein [Mesobacillus maritimus]|uniref:PH domain-containing protein n=1 Tax=Mesobacillus maritimus TaxID=1643336 RepID=UPI00204046B2|nr:PH domain-containing protein [Mesobacillus maritimus]MCM3670501.1 PH domain-containing protein [Mesobacillus maritimus]